MLVFHGFILFLSFVAMLTSAMAGQGPSKIPNIVFILADDMGFECVGANGGSSYSTPNIDQLAAKGIRFINCHSQPVCTPSRVQLMTGKYNVRNYTGFSKLGRDQKTFAHLLKDTGYKTMIAGKWQLGSQKDSPQHFGFQESLLWQQSAPRLAEGHDTRYPNPTLQKNGELIKYTAGEYGPDLISDAVCDFMERNRNQPFLAYYPMLLPHSPFVPTPDSKDYDPENLGSKDYTGDPVYFGDMVAYADKIVGKIVSKVEELGIAENTLIIFTADNGTEAPIRSIFRGQEYKGGKHETNDRGTHVPLIIRWDGKVEAGGIDESLVDFTDFLPSFVDLSKSKLPENFISDGISFIPQLCSEMGQERDWIYGWYSKSGATTGVKEWARDQNYKLYRGGEFYCLADDFEEQNAINPDMLDERTKIAYRKLKTVLNKFQYIGRNREIFTETLGQ